MARYRVNFLKTVCNDVGQERRICQRSLEVDSHTEEHAVERAKQLFCFRERVPDWSLRSDAYEVERPGSWC